MKDGANIAIAAKTTEPHPKLPGTIFSQPKKLKPRAEKLLPLKVDIRDEANLQTAIDKTVETFT